MSFLLDTNVVSELRKAKPAGSVRSWVSSVRDTELYLSVLVVGELRQGIELLRRRDENRAASLDNWLSSIEHAYRERILPVSVQVAKEWGKINVPNRMPAIDGLLAATAKVHGLTLVTRNTGDVRRTGIAVLNPFSPPA
jgi:predicted nucleic acid-binding protein